MFPYTAAACAAFVGTALALLACLPGAIRYVRGEED